MFQPVKGTHDLFDEEANAYSYVEDLMKSLADLFGYKEIRIPVLEYSDLFVRGVGESSDVVRKEMYTFLDKGNRSVTLRPEFTAGIMRSIVFKKLYATNELPLKLQYLGPVFRYERPQLGRYRQFNQFGVESVGVNDPLCDVDTITLAYSILTTLGLEDVTLKINTIGDDESRKAYREALKAYFADKIANMCSDCQTRFELNPLRILDCKVPEDQLIVKNAPKMSDYLSDNAKKRFQTVLGLLDNLGIPYEVDDGLVRGLDYYSETVFEFHYRSSTGNDYGAIGAGGHYGKLVKEVGGPDMAGVGFSFGIERIVSVLKDDNLLKDRYVKRPFNIYIMPMGEKARLLALDYATTLRMWGLKTDICFENVKLPNMFKRAEKKEAKYAVILGDNEVENNELIFKNLETKEQETIKKDDLVNYISRLFNEEDECECGCGHHHHEGECCCDDDCDCDCDDDCDCNCHHGHNED